jgi:hypothetical protein
VPSLAKILAVELIVMKPPTAPGNHIVSLPNVRSTCGVTDLINLLVVLGARLDFIVLWAAAGYP